MNKHRSNVEWLDELQAGGSAQAAAINDLRDYLLHAALYSLGKGRGELGYLSRAEIEQLGQDVAQDALVAIMRHLGEFRSDSKFTTWAYKFAVNFALVAARKERWKRVSLEDILNGDLPEGLVRDDRAAINPPRAALQAEVWATVREIMERDLTERQRQALKAIVFDDVPLDEVARYWNSNRNATYKLLHDARRKLRAGLEARGLRVDDILDLFGE